MTEENNENLQDTMTLISYGGDARSDSFEAIELASQGKFDKAQDSLKKADESLKIAHNKQTDMLTKSAKGIEGNVDLLTVHGQDHLMNALTCRDLAGYIVKLYKRIEQLENE